MEYTFGYAALLLVREDGSGRFYSYAGSKQNAIKIVLGIDVPGYLSQAEMTSNDVERFFDKNTKADGSVEEIGYVPGQGQIYTDGIDYSDGKLYHDGKNSSYTRAVYIPIIPEEGNAMEKYADSLRKNQMDPNNNTNIYNLYTANCSMIAQDILAARNKNFATGSGTAHSWDEQLAMGFALYASTLPGGYVISSNIVVDYIGKDYLDQTIPDAAYYWGYLITKWSLYEEGWEAGKLEMFQGKQYGGCIQ